MNSSAVLTPRLTCCQGYIINVSSMTSTTSSNTGITRPISQRRPPFSPLFLLLATATSYAASQPRMTTAAAAAAAAKEDIIGSGTADDALQLIRAHQDTAARLSPVEEIRTILDLSTRGILSTLSQDHEGYPSGSMVDFACNHDGYPILAVSSLSVHSKNLLGNPKCSLLVAKDPEDRTDIVITLHGDAVSVSDNDREAVRAAYLRKHPDAFWVDFGDFRFIYIKPKFVRYVSGVATALLGSGEFDVEEYTAAKVDPISQFSNPITSHMNKDHAEDTKAIVQHSMSVQVDFAYMIDLDSLGFNVKFARHAILFFSVSDVYPYQAGYQGNTLKLRIPFPRRAEDRKDVKTLIVEMLRAAKDNSSSV